MKVVVNYDFGDAPGHGFYDRSLEVLSLGVYAGVIKQEGSIYYFNEGKINGRENALIYLDDHVAERELLYRELIAVGPNLYVGQTGKHLIGGKAKTSSGGDGATISAEEEEE